jgi:hypothetical protein
LSTGQDLITGGLLNINSFSPGQQLSPQIADQCLIVLNDLLDSLSTDQAFIYTQVENKTAWIPNQYKYTVGNPEGQNPGFFLGNVSQGSAIITNVGVPAELAVGASLTDLQGAIPVNAIVSSFSAVANTVTMNQVALFTPSGLDNVTYTVPGQMILSNGIAMARPLRLRSGFTRVTGGVANGLDYWFDVQNSMDRYNEIGFKGVPGPWPYLLAYQPTYPLGTFWVYPCPAAANEVHIFTDLILSEFTLTQDVDLPQGYSRALKKLLALELCPIFGKTPSPQLTLQAKEARTLLEEQNSSPVVTLRYDSDLVYSRHTDASFILDGGFR